MILKQLLDLLPTTSIVNVLEQHMKIYEFRY